MAPGNAKSDAKPRRVVHCTTISDKNEKKRKKDWNLLCDEAESILTSGNDAKIRQIDRTGTVLKSLNIVVEAAALSQSLKQVLLCGLIETYSNVAVIE